MSVVNTYSILIQQLVGYPWREMLVDSWKSREYDSKNNRNRYWDDTNLINKLTNWLPKSEHDNAHMIIHEHGRKVDTLNNQW